VHRWQKKRATKNIPNKMTKRKRKSRENTPPHLADAPFVLLLKFVVSGRHHHSKIKNTIKEHVLTTRNQNNKTLQNRNSRTNSQRLDFLHHLALAQLAAVSLLEEPGREVTSCTAGTRAASARTEGRALSAIWGQW
jgi:hypothetical protein